MKYFEIIHILAYIVSIVGVFLLGYGYDPKNNKMWNTPIKIGMFLFALGFTGVLYILIQLNCGIWL